MTGPASQVKISRPSHLRDFGVVLQALHHGEEERYRDLYVRLPLQLDALFKERDADPAAAETIIDSLEKTLWDAAAMSADMTAVGRKLADAADAVEQLLKAAAARKNLPPTSDGGFVIDE